eukprot:1159697-Pelagomonas_calceolata.AAC.4
MQEYAHRHATQIAQLAIMLSPAAPPMSSAARLLLLLFPEVAVWGADVQITALSERRTYSCCTKETEVTPAFQLGNAALSWQTALLSLMDHLSGLKPYIGVVANQDEGRTRTGITYSGEDAEIWGSYKPKTSPPGSLSLCACTE